MFIGTCTGGESATRRIPWALVCSVLAVMVAITAVTVLMESDDSDAATIVGRGNNDGLDWTIDSDGKMTLGAKNTTAKYYSSWKDCTTKAVSVYVNDGVTAIPDNMFRGSDIKALVIMTRDLVKIGDSAFYGCKNLSSVTMPYIRVIGGYAFQYCSSLTSVSLHGSIESIGGYAFSRCAKLDRVVFYGEPELGNGVFHSDPALVSFIGMSDYFNADKTMLIVDGVLKAYCAGCTATDVAVPEGVTSIGMYAFAGCNNIVNLNIPAGVAEVNAWAFAECSSLKKVSFPAGLTFMSTTGLDKTFYKADGTACKSTSDFKGRMFILNNGAFRENVSYIDLVDGMSVCPTSTRYDITLRYIAPFTGRLMVFSSGPVDSKAALYDGDMVRLAENDDILSENYIRNFGVAEEVVEGRVYFLKVAAYSSGNTDYVPIYAMEQSAYGYCQSGVFFVMDPYGNVSFAGRSVIDEKNVMGISKDEVRSVRICEGIPDIGYRAFYGYPSVSSVDIGSTVASIGEEAFYDCRSLESVVVPDTVRSLGKDVFGYCLHLSKAVVGSGVTVIPDNAFIDCPALSSITLRGNVTAIGEYAFYNTAFTTMDLPSTLVAIGSYAFTRTRLVEVTIPQNVTDIEDFAFYASSVTGFKVHSDNRSYKAVDGILYSYDMTRLVCYPSGKMSTTYTAPGGLVTVDPYSVYGAKNLQHVYLPGSLELIDNGAFRNCSSLRTVSIADGASVSIRAYSFAECPSLSHVELPLELYSVSDQAFMDLEFRDWNGKILSQNHNDLRGLRFDRADGYLKASNARYMEFLVSFNGSTLSIEGKGVLDAGDTVRFADQPWYPFRNDIKKVEFGEGVTGIGFYMVYGMGNLRSVYLPSTLSTVDSSFIGECPRIEKFEVSPSNKDFTAYYGSLLDKDEKTLVKYPVGKSEMVLVIPSTVTKICERAAVASKHLVIANLVNVEEIGMMAFYNSGVESVYMGPGLKTIGDRAFSNTELGNVRMPSGPVEVGDDAFGGNVFHDNILGRTVSPYTEMSLMAGYSYMGTYPDLYASNGRIGDITWRCIGYDLSFEGTGAIPGYEDWNTPWAYCSVNTLRISEGITSIGSQAFGGYLVTERVEFPSTMAYIAPDAFDETFFDERMSPLSPSAGEFAGQSFETFDYPYGFVRVHPSSVTVTFDIDGFLMTKEVGYGDEVSAPLIAPVKGPVDGKWYMFVGWEGLRGTARVYADTVFKAVFEKVDPCHVTIVYDDGTVYDTDVLPGSVLESPRPVKGYFLDEGRLIAWSEHRTVERDLVLYATVAVSGTLDNIEWTLDLGTNTITVTGEGAMPAFAKNSSTPWYKYRNSIEKIVIDGDVTTVSTYAFYGYSKATEIVIGENVTTLEKYSFKNCTALQTLRVGNGVENINAVAFTNTFMTMDGSKVKINADSFRGRQFEHIDGALRLTSVVGTTGDVSWTLRIDDNRIEFDGEGYMGTYSGPTVVPWYQYRGSINEVHVGEGVRNVCDYAFYSYPSVYDVVLSDTVESIGKNSFRGCPVNTMVFGKGFATVGSNALYGFTFHDGAGNTLKATAKNLCGKEFDGGDRDLYEYTPYVSEPPYRVTIALGDDKYVHMSEGGVFEGFPFAPAAGNHLRPVGWYHYPVGSTISSDSWFDCPYVPAVDETHSGYLYDDIRWVVDVDARTLTVYGGFMSLPDFASASDTPWYPYAQYIDSVYIYDVDVIGANSFRGLPFVYYVYMDDNVTGVGKYAFYREYAIEYMHISESLVSVGTNAFGGLTFRMDDGSTISPVNIAGADVYGTGRTLVCHEVYGGFEDCRWHYYDGVLNVIGDIPDFASTTGAPWSKLNKAVREIVFDDVYTIGERAFYNFVNVKTLDLRNIYEIGGYAFKGCDGLERVEFGSLDRISTVAFSKPFVSFDGSGFGVNAGTMSGRTFALDGDGKLRLCVIGDVFGYLWWTVDFTAGTLVIDGYDAMENLTSGTKYPWYQYRNQITSIVVKDSVGSVGDYAFYSYAKLKSITFGEDVCYIGTNAIRGCSALETVEFHNTMFRTGSNTFYGMTFKDMAGNTLKVTSENLGGHTFEGKDKVFTMVA
ncbi:MAG: leucine-rich repeat domain-containing protein [archaeon]|nr:leucine-rich repeat domain-containing protein [archaeon]